MESEIRPGTVHGEYAAWTGRGSLRKLVEELERQRQNTFDFVCDARNLRFEVVERTPRLFRSFESDIRTSEWIPKDGFPVNDLAVAQLCDRVVPQVPLKFLRSLIEERPQAASSLLTYLLNYTITTNLVRCLDGRVRAFLSDRYAPLDNYTLAFAALDVARSVDAEVIECSLSETNMRVKFVDRKVFDRVEEVRTGGDSSGWYAGGLGNQEHLSKVHARVGGELPGGPGTVHPLVTIGNSEVGGGRLFVRDGILRAVCFNLATVEDVVSNVHLGSRLDPGIFSLATMKKEAEAIMAKASDAIRTAFSPERFKRVCEKVKRAQGVEVKPIEAVDFAVSQQVITEEQRDSLLAHFLGGGVGETAYGFAQAVARLAQDVEDGDSAAALEDFAGKVISSPSLVHAAV